GWRRRQQARKHAGNVDEIYHLRPTNTAASIQPLPSDGIWVLGLSPIRRARSLFSAAPRSINRDCSTIARSEGTMGEEETAMMGKKKIVINGPKAAFLFAVLLILSGCTREEAIAKLKADLPADEFEIIHARFPCRSPDMHFFGYRFRIRVEKEWADGDVCWD